MLKKATQSMTILILVFAIVADVFAGGGKRNGWQVTALEISATGRKISRLLYEINPVNNFIEDTEFKEKFDAAVALYVLEHVPDPTAFLNKCESI